MTSGQALAVVLAPVGIAFLVLAAAPLWVFDRADFWRHQAIWFRTHRRAAWLPRALWGAFAVTCFFGALVGTTHP